MITHLVLWKLTATDAAGKTEAVAAIAGALEPLVGVIDGLQDLTINANVAFLDTNWDVALVSHFGSIAELEAYQVHPEHVKAASIVRGYTTQRANVDFESADVQP